VNVDNTKIYFRKNGQTESNMRAFALCALFLVGSWAEPCQYGVPDTCAQTLCPNSPLSVAALQAIQRAASDKLSSLHPKTGPLNPLIPNLNANPPSDRSCHSHLASGEVQNCGWAPSYRNANESATGNTTGFFDNPDLWYGNPYTGTACKTTNDEMSFPQDQSFKLRDDEAVVWLTCTPANAVYFSYSRALIDLTDNQIIQGLLGESLNSVSIKTYSKDGTHFGAATLIIYAADQDIVDQISQAYVQAGFPASAINVEPWPVAEVNLGSNGQITSSTSTLGVLHRIYKFTTPTASDYTSCVRDFPYVKYTPRFPRTSSRPIAQIETWRPDDAGILKNSEFGFQPILQGVVNAVQTYTDSTLKAHAYTQVSAYTAQPFRAYDLALKWILESRSGIYGTKDSSYNLFPLQLSTNYASVGGLNFSLVCGLDHTQTFSTQIPALTHFPTAVYYNFALYALAPAGGIKDTGLAGGVTGTTPLNITAFPPAIQTALGAVFAKVGVPTASHFYCNYISNDCNLVSGLLNAVPCTTVNPNVPNGHNPMAVIYRAYVNPLTATAPSDVTIVKPYITFYNYRH
jgi:hypothetical protein